MKGQKIKEILRQEGIALSDVASLLGFSNDQRLHSALRSDDVKSGLIEDIARVTNKSIGFFYGCSDSVSDAVLSERVKMLEALLAEKERLIKVLMKQAQN